MGARRQSAPPLKGPRTVIERGTKEYPAAFEFVRDPPKCLYVLGDPVSLAEGLAVVGARKATPYGLGCARRFASAAARRGIVIISGGARGCDAQAHRAALAEGCPTVAFLGGGCDQLYPAEHWRLFQDIVENGGALVSEHPWDHPPLPYAFRARNRLIAGLARATLIVEAGLPSGTFSTADEALAANREVLVVPGAITSASSRGANRLIYQGATPIVDDDTFQDVLFSLFGLLRQETAPEGEFPEKGAGEFRGSGTKSVQTVHPVGAGEESGENAAAGKPVNPPSAAVSQKSAHVVSQKPVRAASQKPACDKPKKKERLATGGGRAGKELVAAVQAEPLNTDELYDLARRLHRGADVSAWLMERLVEAEALGLIARYPDGRWGPAEFAG